MNLASYDLKTRLLEHLIQGVWAVGNQVSDLKTIVTVQVGRLKQQPARRSKPFLAQCSQVSFWIWDMFDDMRQADQVKTGRVSRRVARRGQAGTQLAKRGNHGQPSPLSIAAISAAGFDSNHFAGICLPKTLQEPPG